VVTAAVPVSAEDPVAIVAVSCRLPGEVRDPEGMWDLRPHEHGDWEHAFRPPGQGQPPSAPDPFDQPSPGLAWLCHPALTGLPAAGWDALITELMTSRGRPAWTSAAATGPASTPRVPAAAPPLPWQTGSSLPSCTTASDCPRPPSPLCPASGGIGS